MYRPEVFQNQPSQPADSIEISSVCENDVKADLPKNPKPRVFQEWSDSSLMSPIHPTGNRRYSAKKPPAEPRDQVVDAQLPKPDDFVDEDNP